MNTQITRKSSKEVKKQYKQLNIGASPSGKAVVSKATIREFESLSICAGHREITTVRPPCGERNRHQIENYIVNATAPTEGLLRHAVWRVLGTPLRQDKVDKECSTGQPLRRTSQGTPTYLIDNWVQCNLVARELWELVAKVQIFLLRLPLTFQTIVRKQRYLLTDYKGIGNQDNICV